MLHLAKDDFFEEEEANSIMAIGSYKGSWLQDVAERLPHLHAILCLQTPPNIIRRYFSISWTSMENAPDEAKPAAF